MTSTADNRLVTFIRERWTFPMRCKRIVWRRRIRIFTDGGYPPFRWYPRFRKASYHPHRGMWGFALYLWGREVNFTFGEDVNGLYKDCEPYETTH